MRRTLRREVGGVLAVAGGLLILDSGFRTQSFVLFALSFSEKEFGGSLPPDLRAIITIGTLVLASIIGLGGLLVVVGGLSVLLRHVSIGRLLILLGGGVGFIGIAIALAYYSVTVGPSGIISHITYWIGVVVASLARYLTGRF